MASSSYLRSVFISISSFILVACGGGGSGSSDSTQTPTPEQPSEQTYSVTIIDGYLKDATVWLDINDNGLKDANEPTAQTGGRGIAELNVASNLNVAEYSVLAIAEAGKAYDETLEKIIERSFVLASPAGKSVVTPLTTLIYIKQKETGDLQSANGQIGLAINAVTENLYEDFIATRNGYLESVAADLVRLALMPESTNQLNSLAENPENLMELVKEYIRIRTRDDADVFVMLDNNGELSGDTDLDGIADTDDSDIDGDNRHNESDMFPYDATEWEDLDSDGIGNNSDDDIDGDGVVNEGDAFPYNITEWEDLDNDGIGNNSDEDIDGDGIINEEDNDPYLAEYYTIQNPGNLTISEVITSTILDNDWQYFEIDVPAGVIINIELTNLSEDVDLYVSTDEFPDKFSYQCRSNEGGVEAEKCSIRNDELNTYYIGVLARDDASYDLAASTEAIVYKKALLMLHGLASNPETWNAMINDDSFFNGQCHVLSVNDEALPTLGSNDDGISCFNLEFGSLDRDFRYSARGLDNLTCNSALGCDGDYTTFKGLGVEVEAAIERIIEHLGNDVEIFLFGHSRGGLAARSYLQNDSLEYKAFVKGFATTGTPHQGSPLGRFYKYMDENCTPKSAYRQDGSHCEDNWEVIEMLNGTRTYFGFDIGLEYQMELQAPSVDFLSPESEELNELNENIEQLEQLVIGQLVYEGTSFGVLSKDAGLSDYYDLYDYGTWFSGDHPHPDTLRYVENGVTRESLKGDGIVPSFSQRLNLLLEQEGIDVSVSGTQDAQNVLHVEETSRVNDINWLFERLYQSLGWK